MNSTATIPAPPAVTRASSLGLYAVTIFLSAFLLFQVQPMIAKLILPWFGGSAAVWITCMLFFQIALLAGYGYAHVIVRYVPFERQSLVHIGLLVLSFASLPILPSLGWKPQGNEDPLFRIMGLLGATVGLPYILLSSTSPLLQSWYARSHESGMPYRFFALSNLGSMLALLSYPIAVEPFLSTHHQAWIWSGAFLLFAGCCVATALTSRKAIAARIDEADDASAPVPSWGDRFQWMLLAALASGMLLALTNHMTQNVAPIPFLWIVPLALYLLTFILCFESNRWYYRPPFTSFFAAGLAGLAWFLTAQETPDNLLRALGFLCAFLFVTCMVCHGELARMKPHAKYLTGFYLTISVGGAIGGLFVGFFAPRVFNAPIELPILVAASAFLMLWVFWRERPRGDASSMPVWALGVALALGAAAFYASVTPKIADKITIPRWLSKLPYESPILVFAGILMVIWVLWSQRRWGAQTWTALWAVGLALACGMTGYLVKTQTAGFSNARLMVRNFYGTLRVADVYEDGIYVRQLSHGTINHGEQINDPLRARWATTYYGHNSGVGLSLDYLQSLGPVRMGIIGLGTGSLSVYGRKGDYVRIYDINPQVIDVAQTQFSYVPKNPAKVDLVLGDARLSLEREPAQNFDLLALDAFSSDSIPLHLLTKEAFEVYKRQLKPDGILVVHISNRYLDLDPVVKASAAAIGMKAGYVTSEEDLTADVFSSDWVIVTARPGFFDMQPIKGAVSAPAKPKQIRTWTDDYSNLWQILK